ncbi:MAG: hypothetical protein RLZZ562_1651, partial [Planctomycetota bacterium]
AGNLVSTDGNLFYGQLTYLTPAQTMPVAAVLLPGSGPTGPTGPQGPVGATGATGATGAQGPIGLTGPQGIQGETGLTGPSGPQGIQGIQGIPGDVGPQGPIGLTGPQGATGAQGAPGIPAARYIVDTSLAYGATHTTIQSAIDQAVADGFSNSNNTSILVRPGTYVGNVTLVGGVHLTASVPGKSFATRLVGTVTHTSGVVSMIGIDVDATSGGDAITITGEVPFTQLYLSGSTVYAYGTDNAAQLDVTTDGSSGIIQDNVLFRVLSGAGTPVNVIRGTLQGRSGGFVPASQNTAAIAVAGAGTATTTGRVWLRDADVFGKVTVSGNGEFSMGSGQIRSGSGVAVEDTSSGSILISNVGIQSTLAVGDIVSTNGGLYYADLILSSPYQTMPANSIRLPGTDAISTEAFGGQLANAATIDASGGTLNYTTVAQNSATDVFTVAGGVLTVLKAGTVTVSASMTSRLDAAGEETLTLVRDHATDGTRLLAIDEVVSTSTARGTLKLSGTVKVLPGDRIRVYAASTTAWDLTSDGASSRLNVQWTGVR